VPKVGLLCENAISLSALKSTRAIIPVDPIELRLRIGSNLSKTCLSQVFDTQDKYATKHLKFVADMLGLPQHAYQDRPSS